MAECGSRTDFDYADFHLAMCHLVGFGTSVNKDDFLVTLVRRAVRGELFSSGICERIHSAFDSHFNGMLSLGVPIVEIERAWFNYFQKNFTTHIAIETTRSCSRAYGQVHLVIYC